MARSTPAAPTASGKAARSGSTAAPPGAYSVCTAASASNSAMPRAVSILPTVDLPMPIEPVSATFIMPPPLSSGLSCGQHRDVVIGQLAVAGHQDQVLGLRLGDQHAVEGVAMQQRQVAIGGDMAALQRHRLDAQQLKLGLKIVRGLQLAEASLDRHLPQRDIADEQEIGRAHV